MKTLHIAVYEHKPLDVSENQKTQPNCLSFGLTSERVTTSRLGLSHHMSFGVLYYKIGNLVEEHGAEIILLQKVMRSQPGVL